MTEQTVRIRSTVLVLDREGDETLGVVTVWAREAEALIVFRGPEDAFGFQQHTARYTAREGYLVISMTHEALGALLDREGIGYVVMPEPWSGEGMVDTFNGGKLHRHASGESRGGTWSGRLASVRWGRRPITPAPGWRRSS